MEIKRVLNDDFEVKIEDGIRNNKQVLELVDFMESVDIDQIMDAVKEVQEGGARRRSSSSSSESSDEEEEDEEIEASDDEQA